jgi:hypothetical protein
MDINQDRIILGADLTKLSMTRGDKIAEQ